MTSYPAVRGKDLLAALGRAGFKVSRDKGSHHFLRHVDGRVTVVPVHAGETIGPGLLVREVATGCPCEDGGARTDRVWIVATRGARSS